MTVSENRVILFGIGAAILVSGGFAAAETFLGLFGQWMYVFIFIAIALFGAVIPQLYLLRRDDTVGSTKRLGAITVVLLIVASMLSPNVNGTALTAIWVLFGVAVALIFGYELWAGYEQSTSTP